MTVRVLGEMSLAQAVPLLATYDSGLSLAVGLALPEIQAQISALTAISAALTVSPPSLTATITGAAQAVASLEADPGLPVATGQIAAIATLIADLNASLASLTAAAGLSIPSAAASVYVYEGPKGSFGAEVQSAISGDLPGAGVAHAVVLATTSDAAWSGISATIEVGA